jgi:hypothetical protein
MVADKPAGGRAFAPLRHDSGFIPASGFARGVRARLTGMRRK